MAAIIRGEKLRHQALQDFAFQIVAHAAHAMPAGG
jgi:hypothetical protein